MKNFRFLLILSLLIMVGMAACSDDESGDFVAENTLEPVAVAVTIDRVILDPSNTSNPALTVQWEAAEYGVPTPVRYRVMIAPSSDFEESYLAAEVIGSTSVTWSTSQLNSAVGRIGLSPFQWQEVFLMVVSSVGSQGSDGVTSNVISFEVYPYFTYPFDKDLYLVGPASSAGWNNNNNNPLMWRDPQNQNIYSYTGYFNQDQLKMLEFRGFWAPQYGSGGLGSLAYRPNDAATDPPPIDVATAGLKTFTINVNQLTYSLTDFTGDTGSLLTIGVVGSGLSSGEEVEMVRLSENDHVWYINSVELQVGDLKFRANGTTDWGAGTEFSGTATIDGPAIPIVVGDTYEVWFFDLTGQYIMRPLTLSNLTP